MRDHITILSMAPDELRRFEGKTSKGLECWLWTGALNNQGYGQFYKDGCLCLAHRVSYSHYVAPVPRGSCVLHRCDHPRCVRPDHLWLGTHADNMADCVRKGRNARGATSYAKLTAADVLSIRSRVLEGVPQHRIGKEFGVTQSTISRIKTGDTWVSVQDGDGS